MLSKAIPIKHRVAEPFYSAASLIGRFSLLAFLFLLAADAKSFEFFLFALFIVTSGMTFLETSANPYIREFGSADSYSQRLNFAQAFNGLGAVVATNFLNRFGKTR